MEKQLPSPITQGQPVNAGSSSLGFPCAKHAAVRKHQARRHQKLFQVMPLLAPSGLTYGLWFKSWLCQFTSCVTLSKSLNFSGLQFLHPQN